jgi:hypothetical protein
VNCLVTLFFVTRARDACAAVELLISYYSAASGTYQTNLEVSTTSGFVNVAGTKAVSPFASLKVSQCVSSECPCVPVPGLHWRPLWLIPS